MSDALERVYRVFGPEPLKASDEDLYVNLDDVRGEGGIVNRLGARIRLSGEATCQLLTGHRGSGKSTELRRLQRDLEKGDPHFFVVYCEARSDLDLNDVDFPEVLIAIIRQMATQLEKRADIKLKPGYFKDRWERLKDILGQEVSFEGLDLGGGMLKLTTASRGSPETRKKIRDAMEPDTGNLLYAADDVIGQAKLELGRNGYRDLVILIDDLDHMVLRAHPEAGCSTAEYLFVHRHPQLSAFKCHTVYSMPLALAYSAQEQKIVNLYGGRPPVIAMSKIKTQPPNSREYKRGMDRFRDLISARLHKADVEENDVFDNGKVRDRLIRLSGGQPRELMILIREALIGGGLPIQDAAVDRAEREGRRAFARQLREEHWKIVGNVRKNGALKRTQENDELVRDLLDSRAVLQYVNEKEWYAVNPLIAQPVRRKSK